MASLSSLGTPTICRVKPRLTYSAFLRVTGWVRTTGWTALGYSGYRSMKNLSSEASRAEHKIVRTHPETGRKALFLPRPGAGVLMGLTPVENEAIFRMLYTHAENPDFACRFRWQKGSVAFWDNRCTRHRVTADYFYKQRGFAPHRRHMHRVTIQGDRPV